MNAGRASLRRPGSGQPDCAAARRRRGPGTSLGRHRIGLVASMIVLLAAPGPPSYAEASPAVSRVVPAGGALFAAILALQQERLDPEEIFRRQCVPCHGSKGKGDGPAASALKPRPSDLTDPEVIGPLTDAAILDVLTNGRGSMPSFGALLEPDELRALVGYIRELSGTQAQPQAEGAK